MEIRETRVISVRQEIDYFSVQVENGEPQAGRLLLLATGRCDEIPDKTGFRRFYGRGVYHCPFCDGWEHRNGALVCYGRGRGALDLAVELRTWSADVHLCTDGPVEWSDEELALLAEAEVRHEDHQIASLEGSERLQAISFADQTRLRCDALFFYSGCSQRSTLPERLGCTFDESGAVRCTGFRAIGVTGLFVAGNVQGGLHMAISAAAEGAHAAIDINDELLKRGFLAVAPILQA
ncbi:MAG TPA: FAD-dependent oxidoreductase [Opitutaceae bacterium]|nr:FAD-dependent oxidoreductase [Opitutaceae bacterium]